MSWFRTLVVSVAVLSLAACGFQPLYGGGGTSAAASELAEIKIEPIRDRIGQELHNNLLSLLNPDGRPGRPRYILKTVVAENSASLAVRRSAFATRANLTVRATYNLTAAGTAENVYGGESSITVSYNILDSAFATLAAEKDARSRAIRELAEDMRIRLSVFFANPPTQVK